MNSSRLPCFSIFLIRKDSFSSNFFKFLRFHSCGGIALVKKQKIGERSRTYLHLLSELLFLILRVISFTIDSIKIDFKNQVRFRWNHFLDSVLTICFCPRNIDRSAFSYWHWLDSNTPTPNHTIRSDLKFIQSHVFLRSRNVEFDVPFRDLRDVCSSYFLWVIDFLRYTAKTTIRTMHSTFIIFLWKRHTITRHNRRFPHWHCCNNPKSQFSSHYLYNPHTHTPHKIDSSLFSPSSSSCFS